jgi:hypothetical protein
MSEITTQYRHDEYDVHYDEIDMCLTCVLTKLRKVEADALSRRSDGIEVSDGVRVSGSYGRFYNIFES